MRQHLWVVPPGTTGAFIFTQGVILQVLAGVGGPLGDPLHGSASSGISHSTIMCSAVSFWSCNLELELEKQVGKAGFRRNGINSTPSMTVSESQLMLCRYRLNTVRMENRVQQMLPKTWQCSKGAIK